MTFFNFKQACSVLEDLGYDIYVVPNKQVIKLNGGWGKRLGREEAIALAEAPFLRAAAKARALAAAQAQAEAQAKAKAEAEAKAAAKAQAHMDWVEQRRFDKAWRQAERQRRQQGRALHGMAVDMT